MTTVPDVLVEMSTAVERECLYYGRGAKLKVVSLIFKEAASNFRKTQSKDVFTRLYIHSGHELGSSCQPEDEECRKLICKKWLTGYLAHCPLLPPNSQCLRGELSI